MHGDVAHARHDAHAEHDVDRVGNFEADFGQRRIRRTHDVGNDEHRPPLHRALQHAVEFCVSLGGLGPIVRRAGFFFRRRADERELLDARDIVWIRAMQIRARNFLLVQLQDHALLLRFAEQVVVLLLRTVAPENILRLGQAGDFLHPIEHRLM